MAIFVTDPTYPENEDQSEKFEQELLEKFQAALGQVEIFQADAGPSASIPGWMVSAGVIGWFIFSAPSTIADNLPIWRAHFEKVVNLVREFKTTFSIDVHDAAAIAIDCTSTKFDFRPDNAKVLDIHLHCQNINGIWAHHFDLDNLSKPEEMIQFHQEAVRQYNCRYFILLEHDYTPYSVVIKADGTVELMDSLGRN